MTPQAVYQIGEAKIEIYLAKGLFSKIWLDDEVLEALKRARDSYRVYGKRPTFDKYDKKAAIYLARAIYPSDEEWLSFRLVPGIGTPKSTGELEIFNYRRQNVSDVVRKKFFGGRKDYLEYICSSSRMCGIHPASGRRHKYSAACYALISKHFYDDWLCRMPYEYITGIILNRFVESALTVQIDKQNYGTPFHPAWKFLGGADPEEVKLIRSANGGYAYHFPGYWFNVNQLISLIANLVANGQLTEDSLKRYLGISRPFLEIVHQKLPIMEILAELNRLDRLLTVKGTIKRSRLTGEKLRDLIDTEVGDGPELKITAIETMRNGVEEFLTAVKAEKLI